MVDEAARSRFEAKYSRLSADECWLWATEGDVHGYGSFWLGGRTIKSNRASWLIYHGDIPETLHVCHKCDNPRCVNPDHLFLGTPADNMKDKASKGRAKGGPGAKFGVKHHMAKLNEQKITDARIRIAAGEKLTHIAREFGVNHSCLSVAVRGRTWPSARQVA